MGHTVSVPHPWAATSRSLKRAQKVARSGARQRFELKEGGRGDGAAARDEITALTLGAGHAAAYRAACADLG